MIHGHGTSREGCILDMGVESGLIEKSGSWLLHNGQHLGQGRDNAKAFLQGNPALADELEKALRAKYLAVTPAQQAPAPEKTGPENEAQEPQKAPGAKVLKKVHA